MNHVWYFRGMAHARLTLRGTYVCSRCDSYKSTLPEDAP